MRKKGKKKEIARFGVRNEKRPFHRILSLYACVCASFQVVDCGTANTIRGFDTTINMICSNVTHSGGSFIILDTCKRKTNRFTTDHAH